MLYTSFRPSSGGLPGSVHGRTATGFSIYNAPNLPSVSTQQEFTHKRHWRLPSIRDASIVTIGWFEDSKDASTSAGVQKLVTRAQNPAHQPD